MTAQPVVGPSASSWRDWRLFIPKSITVIAQQGYRLADFRADAMSGLTVAIVALPLAMAVAIASGVTPAQGLITAVVGGFLISALGGARFQIGGPTGAFIVVVYGVVQKHGYDGLDAAFPPPRAFVLRLRDVPLADASGVGALERFLKRCVAHGTAVMFCEMQPRARAVLAQMGVLAHAGVQEAGSYEEALTLAAAAARRD
jgi:MFS superfamily sulfate permease-like transporter